MNKLHYIVISVGVTLLSPSCVSNLNSPADVSTVPASVSSEERGVAERVFSLVNNERVRAGKRAMRGHGGLNMLAQKHSAHMGSTMKSANHLGSENRAQYAYLKFDIENMSEMTYAVPSGASDPAVVAVAAWKSSAEHHRHMLQAWDLTGVGVKRTPDGITYVTMCVGARPMGVPRGIQPVGWQ